MIRVIGWIAGVMLVSVTAVATAQEGLTSQFLDLLTTTPSVKQTGDVSDEKLKDLQQWLFPPSAADAPLSRVSHFIP
jgi:hypothetical protein